MALTKAKYEANRRYDAKAYDHIGVKLPKGLKDEILAHGYTINGFMVEAAKEKLNKIKDAN